jgi:hypothetical protein
MRLTPIALGLLLATASVTVDAQSKRAPHRAPARPSPTAQRTEAAKLDCPNVLGDGLRTGLRFCDILTGRTAADGATVHVPRHRGTATLTFDLHNRQTVSNELATEGRAYTKSTATVGVLSFDGTVLGRGVIQTEYRVEGDLLDRIGGGAGPGGIKAVAPVGTQSISAEVPEGLDLVSIVGEKLEVVTVDGASAVATPGRPVAIVSNVKVQYRPGTVTKKGKKR